MDTGGRQWTRGDIGGHEGTQAHRGIWGNIDTRWDTGTRGDVSGHGGTQTHGGHGGTQAHGGHGGTRAHGGVTGTRGTWGTRGHSGVAERAVTLGLSRGRSPVTAPPPRGAGPAPWGQRAAERASSPPTAPPLWLRAPPRPLPRRPISVGDALPFPHPPGSYWPQAAAGRGRPARGRKRGAHVVPAGSGRGVPGRGEAGPAGMDPLRAQQLAAELEVDMMADMYNRCALRGGGGSAAGFWGVLGPGGAGGAWGCGAAPGVREAPGGAHGWGGAGGYRRRWGISGCWGVKGCLGGAWGMGGCRGIRGCREMGDGGDGGVLGVPGDGEGTGGDRRCWGARRGPARG